MKYNLEEIQVYKKQFKKFQLIVLQNASLKWHSKSSLQKKPYVCTTSTTNENLFIETKITFLTLKFDFDKHQQIGQLKVVGIDPSECKINLFQFRKNTF